MMRHHELALDHSNKLPLTGERFASYDAFVAGYEAALNDLKMPTIEKAVATVDKPSDNKGSAQQAA